MNCRAPLVSGTVWAQKAASAELKILSIILLALALIRLETVGLRTNIAH